MHKGGVPFIPECPLQAVDVPRQQRETAPTVADLCSAPWPVAETRGCLSHTAVRAPVLVPCLQSLETSLGGGFFCHTSSRHAVASYAPLPIVHLFPVAEIQPPYFNGRQLF